MKTYWNLKCVRIESNLNANFGFHTLSNLSFTLFDTFITATRPAFSTQAEFTVLTLTPPAAGVRGGGSGSASAGASAEGVVGELSVYVSAAVAGTVPRYKPPLTPSSSCSAS